LSLSSTWSLLQIVHVLVIAITPAWSIGSDADLSVSRRFQAQVQGLRALCRNQEVP